MNHQSKKQLYLVLIIKKLNQNSKKQTYRKREQIGPTVGNFLDIAECRHEL